MPWNLFKCSTCRHKHANCSSKLAVIWNERQHITTTLTNKCSKQWGREYDAELRLVFRMSCAKQGSSKVAVIWSENDRPQPFWCPCKADFQRSMDGATWKLCILNMVRQKSNKLGQYIIVINRSYVQKPFPQCTYFKVLSDTKFQRRDNYVKSCLCVEASPRKFKQYPFSIT